MEVLSSCTHQKRRPSRSASNGSAGEKLPLGLDPICLKTSASYCVQRHGCCPKVKTIAGEALEQGFEAAKNIIIGNTAPRLMFMCCVLIRVKSCKSEAHGVSCGSHVQRPCMEQHPVSVLSTASRQSGLQCATPAFGLSWRVRVITVAST